MARLSAQQRDGGLDVSWWRPQGFSNIESELISGYSVRWCSASGSPSKCTSVDVSRDVTSYHIDGLEAGVTYNVSVKLRTHFANENWASILTSSASALKSSAGGMSPLVSSATGSLTRTVRWTSRR